MNEDRWEIDKQLRKRYGHKLVALYKKGSFWERKGAKWRKQEFPKMGYFCENECGVYGNYGMYRVNGKAMCPLCASKELILKFSAKNSI